MKDGSATILVVDDNEAGRYATARLLRHVGFTVKEAATGAEALGLASEKPDLVVLDVNLPDMSGLEVCRLIKGAPATESIPVLHLSATCIDKKSRVTGLESGADGYLVQPVEGDELVATVNALLRMKVAEARAKAAVEERDRTIERLEEAIKEIKTLSALLPMCSYCRKIRDDDGAWQQFDVYLKKNTDTRVSHGICEECAKKHYPGYQDALKEDEAADRRGGPEDDK